MFYVWRRGGMHIAISHPCLWEVLFCNLALKYLNIFFNISDKGSEEKTCREGEWAEEGEELRGFWGRGGKGRVEVPEGKVEEGGVLRDVADILTWSEKEIYAVTVGRSILGLKWIYFPRREQSDYVASPLITTYVWGPANRLTVQEGWRMWFTHQSNKWGEGWSEIRILG